MDRCWMLKVEAGGKLFWGKDKSEWVDPQAGERVEELKEAEWRERGGGKGKLGEEAESLCLWALQSTFNRFFTQNTLEV